MLLAYSIVLPEEDKYTYRSSLYCFVQGNEDSMLCQKDLRKRIYKYISFELVAMLIENC